MSQSVDTGDIIFLCLGLILALVAPLLTFVWSRRRARHRPQGCLLWLFRCLNLESVAGFAVFSALHELSRDEIISGVAIALSVISLFSYFATVYLIARLDRSPQPRGPAGLPP